MGPPDPPDLATPSGGADGPRLASPAAHRLEIGLVVFGVLLIAAQVVALAYFLAKRRRLRLAGLEVLRTHEQQQKQQKQVPLQLHRASFPGHGHAPGHACLWTEAFDQDHHDAEEEEDDNDSNEDGHSFECGIIDQRTTTQPIAAVAVAGRARYLRYPDAPLLVLTLPTPPAETADREAGEYGFLEKIRRRSEALAEALQHELAELQRQVNHAAAAEGEEEEEEEEEEEKDEEKGWGPHEEQHKQQRQREEHVTYKWGRLDGGHVEMGFSTGASVRSSSRIAAARGAEAERIAGRREDGRAGYGGDVEAGRGARLLRSGSLQHPQPAKKASISRRRRRHTFWSVEDALKMEEAAGPPGPTRR